MSNHELEIDPDVEVEKDVWIQMPPKREFTIVVNIVFRGRGKPDPLPDELECDSESETVTR